MEKYFMHRIKVDNGSIVKGIEIHDTLDSAIGSFHAYMKTGYGSVASITFVSCKITDGNGNIVQPYTDAWIKENSGENKFFLHHIRRTGESFDKNIDVFASYDAAISAFHDQMSYGYDNPTKPDVNYVSCMIDDLSGSVMKPFFETWEKAQPEPEPEPEPEPTEE